MTEAYTIKFIKDGNLGGMSRYDVLLDDVKVGWVTRLTGSYEWSFFATVRKWAQGEALARGCESRRDAVMEGVSSLRIWHGSCIIRLNHDTIDEERVWFEGERLEATWQKLLDEKYPVA